MGAQPRSEPTALPNDAANAVGVRRVLEAICRIEPRLQALTPAGADPRTLRFRLALQLPRLEMADLADYRLILRELEHVSARLTTDLKHIDSCRVAPADDMPALEECEVREVDVSDAYIIHRVFHYIGSEREGKHYGLYRRGVEKSELPLTLLTFSAFDLNSVQACYADTISPSNASVLSRVYSFPGSPRNAFSYTFKRALNLYCGEHPELGITLTYVNPNVGFSGSSYRASNWVALMREVASYDYLDDVYITRRELSRRFGVDDPSSLLVRLKGRLTASRIPLMPLTLFATGRDHKTRLVLTRLLHSEG
jgi:hypothetical protein